MNTLTTQAVEKLLQQPDVKVIRNPLHNEAVNITIIALTLIWLGLLLMIIMESIETPDLWKAYWTLLVILIAHIAACVAVFIGGRRTVLALNKEGMYLSTVNTEDFRGPLSLRRHFFHWDEITELTLSSGPTLSFRIKGRPYGFTLTPNIMTNEGFRAKRYKLLIEDISAYSGFPHHFHQDSRNNWKFIFATPFRPANTEVDEWDWDSLQPVRP